MKILILANNSDGLYGFRRELISELVKNNEVVCSAPDMGFVDALRALGVQVIETPIDCRGINPKTDLSLFQTYRAMLKSVKPDLVITYTIKPNVYGGFACRLAKIPYAVNITGLGTAFEKSGALRSLVTNMYKSALKKVRVVFFENDDNLATFVNTGIVPKNRCKLLNGAGVNLQHYSANPYPSEEGPVRFLFVGRVMHEKGVDEFFAAARKMKQDYGEMVSFDVIGNIDDDYVGLVQEMTEAGIVLYHGYQLNPRPFYASCHCVVLPSYHEGMSNVLLEAAASGRPLITSAIPGCQEAVLHGVSGLLCEPKDENSLHRTMDIFFHMPYPRKADMGYEGRKLMEQKFDKVKVVQATMEGLGL